MVPLEKIDPNKRVLILLRHAEALRLGKNLSDFHRSLTERGKNDLIAKIEDLKNMGVFPKNLPQKIFSSSSDRTMQTAELFTQITNIDLTPIKVDELYEQQDDILEQLTRCLENSLTSVMIVGHNPLIENWTHLNCSNEIIPSVDPGTFLFLSQVIDSWNKSTLNKWTLEYCY